MISYTTLIGTLILTIIITIFIVNLWAKSKAAFVFEKVKTLENQLMQEQHRYATAVTEKENGMQNIIMLKTQNQNLTQQNTELSNYRTEYFNLKSEYALLQNQIDLQNQNLKFQKEQFGEILKNNKLQFEQMAQKILQEKSIQLTEMGDEKMNNILNPLKDQINDFKKKVEETYDKESKERFTLEREVQRLVETSKKVSEEANNLSSALKNNNKVQGNWGEMILESILSNCGLAKNREYFLQEALRDQRGNVIKDEEGKSMIPDAIIEFPDKRKVIIDSKVSLIAWDNFVNSELAPDKSFHINNHIKSIKAHIDGLSKKNYPFYAGAIDFVLMFVPIEPAFIEAIRIDTQLWKYAYDKKIILGSPTNLFAVLKIVGDLWKVENQNKNALDIANRAGALLDKFANFYTSFENVGKKMNEANILFSQAQKQLQTGNGNIIKQLNDLKQMGVKSNKNLPYFEVEFPEQSNDEVINLT